MTTILEKEGFKVVGARDGKEAYKALQQHSDIIAAVFDVVMPHISGPELVRYMVAKGQPVERRIDTGVQVVTRENMEQPAMKELLHPDLSK